MALTKISRGLLSTGVSDSSDATAITIDSSERVGIGTTSPTGKLEIAATGTNAAPHIKLTESGDTREFNIYNDGSGNGHLVLADSDDDTSDTEIVLNDNGIITMLTGNSERMRIDSSGNVLVGTTTFNNLSTESGVLASNNVVMARGGLVDHQDACAVLQYSSDTTWLRAYGDTAGSGLIVFRTGGGAGSNDAEAMRIDAAGNVGIGTSSPDRQLSINDFSGNGTLSINASTSGACTVYFADGSSGTSIYAGYIQYSHSDNSMQFATNGGSERMRITSGGGVGINTTSVTGALTVQELSNQVIRSESTGSGTVTHLQFVKTSGGAAQIGAITGTTSSVSYTSGSDYRLKENVITDWDATTLLKSLKPSKFNFKDNQSETVTGFIAHEVQEVLPYLVNGEKDGEDMQSMDYAKLTPLLTKAIQEQQELIEDLQTRIEELEA
jgi:hypothetical protein